MAPRPEKSHHVSSSFHHTAVNPSFLMKRHSGPLCRASHSSSHLFCSPSPATSPNHPFSFDFGDLPEGSCLSHSAPTSDPALYSNSTSTTVAKAAARLGISHSSLSTLPLPDAFYSLSSLPESPQLLATCATPHQQVDFSSRAPAFPISEYTVAAGATRPHATALLATTPVGDVITEERTTRPAFENTEEEEPKCSFAPFQKSVKVFKKWSSVHPPTASPEFLRVKQSNGTASAAAAQPAATGWEAAPHSCYQDREACHPFAHIVPTGLRNSYSLHGRTLLSPPAADFPSPVEEGEAEHAGLRLDSPLRTRLSSPTSVHSYNHNDPSEWCSCAFTNALREASRPPSPALYNRPYNSCRLPAFVSLPYARGTSSSPRRCPCESHVSTLSTHEVRPAEPEQRQSTTAIIEQPMLPLRDLKIFSEDEAQRIVLSIDEGATKATGYIKFDVEGFTAKSSENHRIRPSIFDISCEEEHNKAKNKSTDMVPSYSFPRKKTSKPCTSSPHVSSQQTMAGTGICQRGNNRRKRRRGTSPTHSQGGTSTSVESSRQNELHCHVPATMAATCDATSPEPRLALRLKSASAAPLTASPAAMPIGPSTITDNAISAAGDVVAVTRSVAPAGVNRASAISPASIGTGAVDAATMLSASFNGSEAGATADGVPMASPAFVRGATSAPVDETLGMSASRALPGFDYHFCGGPANEQITFYSDTSTCLAHGNMRLSGSVHPADVSALSGAASTSLSPAAIVYALAVKLFGFTPTRGFLPDPNPFDDPDHDLTRKLMRAKIKNRKNLGVQSSLALSDLRVPPVVTGQFVSADRALPTPAAADSRLSGTGNTSAHTRQPFNPSAQRGEMQTKFLAANPEYAQPHCFGHVRLTEEKNYPEEHKLYTHTVPSASATTTFCCESPPPVVRHFRSRTGATSTLRTGGNARDSTRFSQQPATVECYHPSTSSTLRHRLHVGPTAMEGWYTQSEAHPPATNLVNEVGHTSESGYKRQREVSDAEYQTQDTSLVGRQYHAHGVESCAYSTASINGSPLTFNKGERGERHYMQDGSSETEYEVSHEYDDGQSVLKDVGGGGLHTAQFPVQAGHCPGTISYADEEPRCDCVTGTYGIGGKVVHSGRFDIRPAYSYGKDAAPDGEPIQNSSYLPAAADFQCRENRIYMPSYIQGNDLLYPSLHPHNDELVSECSVEFPDRVNAAVSPSTELMAEGLYRRNILSSKPATFSWICLCSGRDE